jgi:predicted transcriptional regulator
MGNKALKLEFSETGSDWWQELSEEQKRGIERGLRDIDAGRVTPHDQVKGAYGI